MKAVEGSLGLTGSVQLKSLRRSNSMPISLMRRLGMMLRKVPVGTMRQALATVEEHDLPITLDQLEAHYLAGGDVERVVQAAVKAQERVGQVEVMRLLAADLAGEDLDAFVERGYVSEREERRRELRARADHDASAARELHSLIDEDLQEARRAADRVGEIDRLSDSQREQLLEGLTDYRSSLENELARLEAQWPGLSRSG